ncbi:flagellar basal body rod C-terminal domain-containing protein [Pseudaeromonas pectinilytica]
MDALVQKNGALFMVRDSDAVTYSRAQERSNGEIVGGSIELANVDLAEEFAEMMIIQRGYQASSRVMNISNEMIETLYGSTR